MPQSEDEPSPDVARMMSEDKTTGATRTKHVKAPAARATRGGSADSANHGGQGSDAGSSSDRCAEASSPTPQASTEEAGTSSTNADIED